jgi:DNA uptake protein ComE-like DNA-binding protein
MYQMKHRIIETVVLALGLWMFAGLSVAADAQPRNGAQPAAVKAGKTPAAKKPAAPQPVLVDINSASREELKKVPGIGDAEADRIIAGRPFLSKAHLQTRNIVSPLAYQQLRERVVARQKDARFGKAAAR